jgi:hypothetical protein
MAFLLIEKSEGPAHVTLVQYEAEHLGWEILPERRHRCPHHRITPLKTHPFEPFDSSKWGQDRCGKRIRKGFRCHKSPTHAIHKEG